MRLSGVATKLQPPTNCDSHMPCMPGAAQMAHLRPDSKCLFEHPGDVDQQLAVHCQLGAI